MSDKSLLDNFHCKNCKRLYSQLKTFLTGGVCIECILQAMELRRQGIFTEKSKGNQLQTSKRELASARPHADRVEKQKEDRFNVVSLDLLHDNTRICENNSCDDCKSLMSLLDKLYQK